MRLIVAVLLLLAVAINAGDMLMKSIVFDKKTPGVFYCPQHKPTGLDKMIVRSRPLKKLCEFDNKKPLPPDYKSDCYHDIDESEWACKEKYRIMMRLYPPGSEDKKNSDKWQRAYNKYIKRKQQGKKQY
ncbi:uncharacterized protein isoform X1 [Rhodnius prolixus]|uniref:Uncharacterized protein n=2 Tax=Rhodnius prolixus TaxID=13249 RepID=R4G4E3_RHOPR